MHIEENKIEQLVVSPEVFSVEEKERFIVHINGCAYCKEVYEMYQKIYSDLEEGIKEPATQNDEEIARRIMMRLNNSEDRRMISEKSAAVEIRNGKTEIVERPKLFSLQGFYYLLKNHPVQFAGSALGMVLIFALLFISVKKSVRDDNPTFADVRNSMLNIYNSSGEILWKKTADGIPEVKSDILFNWGVKKRYLNIIDLDSNGKNEVLISGDLYNKGYFQADSLYCYESDGSLRWVIGPEKISFPYVPQWKRTTWHIRDFFTIKTNKQNRLFVIANDAVYAMTIISEIDPQSGKVLASLYHSGWFMTDLPYDVDKDGSDEIFIGATSNDYQKPVLIVLKPGELSGVLDKTAFFNTDKITKGNPLYYMLFPVSNFGKYLSKSNSYDIYMIHKTDRGICLESEESYSGGQLGLVFNFDKEMSVINVIPTNPYQKQYEDLYKKGIFKQPLDSAYWKAIKDSVLYWHGDKFVNYPTKNKYWNQK